jgi:hypothetical protein
MPFELGNIVQEKSGDRRGLIVPDFMHCCVSGEIPVLWEEDGFFTGVPRTLLKDLGPENPQPSLEHCGAGKGKGCCIFLSSEANGFTCQRAGELRYSLIIRKDKMGAQREPSAIFPACRFTE